LRYHSWRGGGGGVAAGLVDGSAESFHLIHHLIDVVPEASEVGDIVSLDGKFDGANDGLVETGIE
jgi:hypothetical protein